MKKAPDRKMIDLIDPKVIVAMGTAICFVMTFIPPRFYEYISSEPDNMFMNIKVYAIFFASGLSFYFGQRLARGWFGRGHLSGRPIAQMSLTAIWPPLIVAMILGLVSLRLLLANSAGIIDLLLSPGSDVKSAIDTTDALTQAHPLLEATLLWALVNYLANRSSNIMIRRLTAGLMAMGFVIAFLLAIVRLARFQLYPFLIGIGIVMILTRFRNVQLSISRLISIVLPVSLLIFCIFVLFAFQRTGRMDYALQSFMGYGPTAVNHMSYLVDGRMSFRMAHTGAYVFGFLNDLPFLHSEFLGGMTSRKIMTDEFLATAHAGLDATYNWVTAPGYVFVDIGYSFIIYFFLVGFIYGLLWISVMNGRSHAVILFCYISSSTLLWSTFNILNHGNVAIYIIATVAAWGYSHVWPYFFPLPRQRHFRVKRPDQYAIR